MVKNKLYTANQLIFNKKTILTFLLAIFSVSSYTYSGITTNPSESNKTFSTSFILQKSIANNYYYLTPISYLRYKPKSTLTKITKPSEMIMDVGLIKSNILANFLIGTNKTIEVEYAIKLATIYIEEANHEGVNPDIAFAQMCLETGFLRFDGTVDKYQNNFCGLGVTGNGVKGLSFNNTRDGVRAHIQHLKAYASKSDLNKKLIDKRFHFVKRGSATHIDGLTGKWASDIKYDNKIRGLLHRLYNFPS
ncbi:MAG: glucosaminidase domain-containing protein [Bacteroidota bacterium]